MKRRALVTGVIAASLVPAIGAGAAADIDDLRSILEDRVDVRKRAVGMAVGVITPQRRRLVTCGRARHDDARAVTADTVFEIGSITKVFTALLLANMVRRGEVALDDP